MAHDIYIASGWFTVPQDETLSWLENFLVEYHFSFYSPRNDSKPQIDNSSPVGFTQDSCETFIQDCKGIVTSKVVVTPKTSNFNDDGTIWEIGFAFAHHIPVIMYHRPESIQQLNLMPAASINAHCYDEFELKKAVQFALDRPEMFGMLCRREWPFKGHLNG